MSLVLFDVDSVNLLDNEHLKPNVVNKYDSAVSSLKESNAYSVLANYSRLSIGDYVAKITDSLEQVNNELRKIDRYVESAVSNYSALENRLQERFGGQQVDSESLSSSLASIVEISKFSREYKSEDSMAYLEYRPKYTSLTSSSIVSGHVNKSIYGNSISKYVVNDDPNYKVSSVYRSKNNYIDIDSEKYPVDMSGVTGTISKSVINFQTNSSYQQGESTK